MARVGSDERVKIPPDGVLLALTTENFSIIMDMKHVHTSNHNQPSISSGLGVTHNYVPPKNANTNFIKIPLLRLRH